MNGYAFTFASTELVALSSGALWWPEQCLLCVSDLHLGKSERFQRRGGGPLPPYDTQETLARLTRDLDHSEARTLICLGDSFDDTEAAWALPDQEKQWIARLQAGRHWVWIQGNHDPGPVEMGGTHLAEFELRDLTFRHIADTSREGEISGHYHPKVRLRTRGRTVSRPAFLVDKARVILPAFGTYTGGLRTSNATLSGLMRRDALALLTGSTVHAVPMPR